MVAQGLGIAHRLVDGGGAIDRARGLEQDGVGLAVLRKLHGEALHPAGVVDGDGVAVGETLRQVGGGLQFFLPCVRVGRGESQENRQREGGRPAQEIRGGMFHGYSFFRMVDNGIRPGLSVGPGRLVFIIAGRPRGFNA